MKKNMLTKYLFLGVICIFILGGCSSKAREDFDLTIVISEPLGDKATDKLPQDIIELSMPLEGCSDFTLVPSVIIQRLGYGKEKSMALNANVKAGVAGNKNNPRFIRREIEKNLSSKEIGDIFSNPKNKQMDLSKYFESYLSKVNDQSLGIFYISSGGNEEVHKNIKYLASIKSIKNYISSEICVKNGGSVFVFIDPPIASVSVKSSDSHHSSNHLLERLEEINKDAGKLKDKEKKFEILVHVRNSINHFNDPTDYRFTYELVKNSIYGENHHEAFDLLRKAAAIAIKNGQAKYFLDRLEGDKNTDLHKLSIGHSSDWNSIVEGLKHNGIKKINEHR